MSRRSGILALVLIGIHAGLAFGLAWAERSVRDGATHSASGAWFLGPPADLLEAAAATRIDRAVEHLHTAGASDPGWYDAYRGELTAASGLLARSLRACPGEPHALVRLAAVTWELEGPAAGGTGASARRMLELAARAAPDSAPAQVLLGELLLRMAQPDDAGERLRRAVALDPTLAARAVRAFREHAFDPAAILAILGPAPAVLLALQGAFLAQADPTDYLDALEAALPSAGAELLAAYAESCIKLGLADRLLATLDALAPFSDPRDEAQRLDARSRARLARSENQLALEDARRARALAPEDPRWMEQLGRAALAADDADGAVAAFRAALGAVAKQAGAPATRARLYRMIGVAEERHGRRDRAYDAYLKALELDPADVHAARRVAEMRKAAGFATP